MAISQMRSLRMAVEISAAPAFSLLCDASLEHVPKFFLSHDQIPRVRKENLGTGDNGTMEKSSVLKT